MDNNFYQRLSRQIEEDKNSWLQQEESQLSYYYYKISNAIKEAYDWGSIDRNLLLNFFPKTEKELFSIYSQNNYELVGFLLEYLFNKNYPQLSQENALVNHILNLEMLEIGFHMLTQFCNSSYFDKTKAQQASFDYIFTRLRTPYDENSDQHATRSFIDIPVDFQTYCCENFYFGIYHALQFLEKQNYDFYKNSSELLNQLIVPFILNDKVNKTTNLNKLEIAYEGVATFLNTIKTFEPNIYEKLKESLFEKDKAYPGKYPVVSHMLMRLEKAQLEESIGFINSRNSFKTHKI